jgi:hypothetical protein
MHKHSSIIHEDANNLKFTGLSNRALHEALLQCSETCFVGMIVGATRESPFLNSPVKPIISQGF